MKMKEPREMMLPSVVDVFSYVEPLLSSGGLPCIIDDDVSGITSSDKGCTGSRSTSTLSVQAEALAGMALVYEHQNRRRLLLASTTSALLPDVSSSKQDNSEIESLGRLASAHRQPASYSSSQPSRREVASLLHRLVHTLPAQLLGSPLSSGGLTAIGPSLLLVDDMKPRETFSSSDPDVIVSSCPTRSVLKTTGDANKESRLDAFKLKLRQTLTQHHPHFIDDDWWKEGLMLQTWSLFFNR
jgi:hypothetical protein